MVGYRRDETGGLLGVAWLRVGVVPAVGTGDLFSGGLWESEGVSLGGCAHWLLPPFDDHGRWQRSVLVLAAEKDEQALSASDSSDGDPAMTPRARYLMDAAKVRYELRVRQHQVVPSYRLSHRADMPEAGVILSGDRPWEQELDRLISLLPPFGRPDNLTDVL
ncbi:hypothetical protein Asp14428_73430 [Actinoplanes sp. NBRC 14428]|nr:hypothetical protein Asp14428_73430 [Actinoplanes sp. NBRC 14428]